MRLNARALVLEGGPGVLIKVILIDQIDMDMARGLHPWDVVIDATTNRFRIRQYRPRRAASCPQLLSPIAAVCH